MDNIKWSRRELLKAGAGIALGGAVLETLSLRGMLKISSFRRPRGEDDDERHEPHDEEDDDGYHLGGDDDDQEPDAGPRESIADRRLAERREGREPRVKRDTAKKVVASEKRKQTALNLDSGEYQLPALDLLTELRRHLSLVLFADLADAVEHNRLGRERILSQGCVEQFPGIQAGVSPSAIAVRSNSIDEGSVPATQVSRSLKALSSTPYVRPDSRSTRGNDREGANLRC